MSIIVIDELQIRVQRLQDAVEARAYIDPNDTDQQTVALGVIESLTSKISMQVESLLDQYFTEGLSNHES